MVMVESYSSSLIWRLSSIILQKNLPLGKESKIISLMAIDPCSYYMNYGYNKGIQGGFKLDDTE